MKRRNRQAGLLPSFQEWREVTVTAKTDAQAREGGVVVFPLAFSRRGAEDQENSRAARGYFHQEDHAFVVVFWRWHRPRGIEQSPAWRWMVE